MPVLKTKDGLSVPVPDGATEAQKRQAVAEYRANAQRQAGKPAPQPTQAPGALSTAAQHFGQGAGFGFTDEASGAVQAAIPSFMPGAMAGKTFGERYRTATDSARDQLKAGQQAHGTVAGMSELAGGLTSGIALGGSAAAGKAGAALSKAVPMRWAQYGLAGAGAGGVAGAGYSEADTAGGVATDTAWGTALGGALGTVAQPLGRGIGAAAGWVGGKAAPVLARMLPPSMTYKGLIKRGMEWDQSTAEDMVKKLDKLGPDALPFELGDESLMSLVEATANAPGPVRSELTKRLTERAVKSQAAATDDLLKTLGLDDVDFTTAIKESKARAQQVAKHFDPIVNTTKVQLSDRLIKLFDNESMQAALRRANIRTRLDISAGEVSEDALKNLASFYNEGYQSPTLRTLWYVRRGLDDAINDASKSDKTLKSVGQDALKARKILNAELSKISPEFRDVSKMYADEESLQEALDLGRKFTREHAEVTAEVMEGLSDAEKNMFRIGAGRTLRDQIVKAEETAGANVRTLLTTLQKERIRALYDNTKAGKDAYEKFINGLEREITFSRSKRRLLEGSATARRMAQQSGAPNIGSEAYQAGRGDFSSLQGAILRDVVQSAQKVDPRAQQAAALFLQRPENKKVLIDMLRKQQTKQFQQATGAPTTAGYMTSLEMGRQSGK